MKYKAVAPSFFLIAALTGVHAQQVRKAMGSVPVASPDGSQIAFPVGSGWRWTISSSFPQTAQGELQLTHTPGDKGRSCVDRPMENESCSRCLRMMPAVLSPSTKTEGTSERSQLFPARAPHALTRREPAPLHAWYVDLQTRLMVSGPDGIECQANHRRFPHRVEQSLVTRWESAIAFTGRNDPQRRTGYLRDECRWHGPPPGESFFAPRSGAMPQWPVWSPDGTPAGLFRSTVPQTPRRPHLDR